MSESQSALARAEAGQAIRVKEAGLIGMVTLRGDLSNKTLRDAVAAHVGPIPERRAAAIKDHQGIAWMSPDELLILCPHDGADALVARLGAALAGEHALVVNVSDARAVFTLSGDWRAVVARLSPTDLRGFAPGEMRRTRLGQAAAALWCDGEAQATVICFRSMARYMFDLLAEAARSGPLVSQD